MHRRSGKVLLAIFVVLLSFDVSTTLASAEIKSHFDLPAEPLDKALRDFAIQANCNISYEPSLVAGLQAPAIKGEFTPASVLTILLTGTRLRAVNVNEDTVQVLEKSASTSRQHSLPDDGNDDLHADGVVHIAYAGSDAQAGVADSTDPNASNSTPSDKEGKGKKDLEEIVVTGTYIRGISPASPVIEIGREDIDRSGYTSITDVMLSLPENFGGGYNPGGIANNSLVNSRYADNPAGASVPNLRGLGPGSTLTLVDGHRMAAGLPGGGEDISSIPLDAIDHIEIVTDSASAAYGSDAVAGVVNVILKKNYDGAKSSLSYGLAPDGGGTEKRASQLFGTNWSGGDGIIAYEYMQQDAVDAKDRDFTSSAAIPNSLLPELKSNAVTVSATQELSTTASVFVDGLYVARDANHLVTDPGVFPASIEYPSTLRKYEVAAGFNFELMGDWKATLFENAAEDETVQNDLFLTVPSITPSSAERSVATMRSVEANANGTIGNLPTGTMRLAVGAGYRKEAFSDALGTTGSLLTSEADGDRNIRYAFGELSIPVVKHSDRAGLNSIDLTVSGRTEKYSDFGDKTVPKVGVVYVPTSSVKLRSTWGQAFRAPNLYDVKGVQQLVILDLADPMSATGSSPVLLRSGGNPSLQPETADAWSFGVDYSDPALNSPQLSATVFDIQYKNRISQIGNLYAALTDPLNAFFVTPSPSTALAQSVFNAYPPSQIFNVTGAPFSPGSIAAVVDSRLVNVASQTARGADINVGYRIDAALGGTFLFLNGTYLDLTQRDTPQSPEQTLSGLAFYPPRFRVRTGVTWSPASWAFTGTVNYLAHENNTQITPIQEVGSWTTIDASVRYAPNLSGAFAGLHLSVAVLNAFDRNPPHVLTTIQGLNYDSSNTSPLGRFINLQISKEW
jgi:outer membrane receptor protein involved in Fe transport